MVTAFTFDFGIWDKLTRFAQFAQRTLQKTCRPTKHSGDFYGSGCSHRTQIGADQRPAGIPLADRMGLFDDFWEMPGNDVVYESVFPGTRLGNPDRKNAHRVL